MSITSGPYHIGGKDRTIVFCPDGYAIADTKTFHGQHGGLGAAQDNAKLLAASWSLLTASTSLLSLWTLREHFPDFEEELKRRMGELRQAVADAMVGQDPAE